MKKFQKIYEGNSISASSNIAEDSHRFLFWSWTSFNKSRTVSYYTSDINSYFNNCRNKNLSNIKIDRDNTINDIKVIVEDMKCDISKYENNKMELDNIMEEIEKYSNKHFVTK